MLPLGLLTPCRRGVSAATLVTATLTTYGRRAVLLSPISAAVVVVVVMMLGAVRLLSIGWALCGRGRGRRGSSAFAVAEAAKAEERERAAATAPSFIGTLTVVRARGASLLHLTTTTLADPFVPGEGSSPHTEPAMDGRRFATTAPTVVLLYIRAHISLFFLNVPSKYSPYPSQSQTSFTTLRGQGLGVRLIFGYPCSDPSFKTLHVGLGDVRMVAGIIEGCPLTTPIALYGGGRWHWT